MAESGTLNETLIRDVVDEVLGRLGHGKAAGGVNPAPRTRRSDNRHGVFQDPAEACKAAHDAFLQLQEKGMETRRKIVEILKRIPVEKAKEWGKLELDETKIGRIDHKIEKLLMMPGIPGVEDLQPEGFSGDHGITLEERCPFGVIAAVTPATHSIPTLTANAINMVAAGNAVVFNAHPGAVKCAVEAARTYNEAISRETGVENIICIIEHPTLESFDGICTNEHTRLVVVTGGPGVVKAAMKTGKRAICAGPGNPPVLVAEDCCPDRAANSVITGGGYDNNLLCIGEKEVFVVDSMFERFMSAMKKHGAADLSSSQLDRLTEEAFTFETGKGGGCGRAHVNKDYVGSDASVLARTAGTSVADDCPMLFAETSEDHPFVIEEQMMPFIPVVRVRDVNEGIKAARRAEHGYRHTAIIHTHNVNHMTAMARAMDTTLFIKNGPCVAGLAAGGEGYSGFTIATPTGEGVTRARTFTRLRRCTMVDNLRIY